MYCLVNDFFRRKMNVRFFVYNIVWLSISHRLPVMGNEYSFPQQAKLLRLVLNKPVVCRDLWMGQKRET